MAVPKKTAAQKTADQLGSDDGDEREELTLDNFDPLLEAASRLPSSIWGSEGDQPHVFSASDDPNVAGNPIEADTFDDELGGGVGDPSTFTGD